MKSGREARTAQRRRQSGDIDMIFDRFLFVHSEMITDMIKFRNICYFYKGAKGKIEKNELRIN